MKVYYFLNEISDENYKYFLDKLLLLESGYSSDDLIDKYYYKVGENNSNEVINYGFFPETLKFIDYYSDKYNLTYSEALKNITWVHNDINFYIYGNKIYFSKFSSDLYTEIKTDDTVSFITSRDSWLSPFFFALYKISEINKNLKVFRPNKREGWIYNDDKIKNTYMLYAKNINIIGKIFVPYIVNSDFFSIQVLLKSVKNNLGRYVVLKRNASQSGDGIKMMDLDFFLKKENLDILIPKYFSVNNSSIFTIFFVPYYEIKTEYRVYYVYNKESEKTRIYTVKNRLNTCEGNIFTNINAKYSLNKDVKVKWSCMSKDKWKDDKKLSNTISLVAKTLGYDKGVIELIRLDDGSFIYSEYNSLGGPLMFIEDQKMMEEYYYDIWKTGMINL